MAPEGLIDEATDLLSGAVSLRRRLHRRPELGLDLPYTQEAVLHELDGLGLRLSVGDQLSSVVGVLEGGSPGPTVLLRGDMDALAMPEDTGLDYASEVDGAMHACGHDSHTAMLVGAARLLAGRRKDLSGNVLFMFQPGEEGSGGAKIMIEESLFDAVGGADQIATAFAIHQSPTIPSGTIAARSGTIMASADTFHIVVRGRGGHASMPHDALDPIPIACEIVTAAHAMITRTISVFDPAVLTVGRITAGTTNNVIPEIAIIEGTLRALSDATRSRLHEHLERLATGIAAAHGATVELLLSDGYPPTINHTQATADVLRIAGELLGDERTIAMPNPVMGAEDFSYVLQAVPGAMAFLGTRPKHVRGRNAAPNHSNRMVLDEDAMANGIALYSAVALDVLTG